ncbi:hypothetical protein DESC_500065 [Desulfosarcina cetonica]|nr:hypothetical protein DESC_500065 [Desulfosarcina cetonica]
MKWPGQEAGHNTSQSALGGAVKIFILRATINRADIIESVLPHVCGYANASAVETVANMPDSSYIDKQNYEPKKG